MKMSFNEQPTETANTETQIATRPDATLATPASTSGIIGETSREDTLTPWLSLVGKTGKLSDKFKPGNFVLNKEVELPKELSVVAIIAQKRWTEYIDFDEAGDGVKPKFFLTKEEAKAAGLTPIDKSTQRGDGIAVPTAQILFFIERPSALIKPEDADVFGTALPSGIEGAFGLFNARGTHYNSTFKDINTAVSNIKFLKENGIWNQRWTLYSNLEQYEGKTWWQSKLKPNGRIKPEDAAFLAEFAAR